MNMIEEASLEFRLRKIDETRNYLLDEIKHSEKYKKTCKYLNYVEHLTILVSTATSGVSFSVFASLVAIPIGIMCPAVRRTFSAITAGIKNYKSIIKKKKKKHDKIVLLGKDKSNTIEVLISKALIGSYISQDEFVSVNNVLREYKMKNKHKILKLLWNILYKSNGNLLCQL